MGFNPTLVRLARSLAKFLITEISSFNPTLVRLALQTRVPARQMFRGFNPTLVRLAPELLIEEGLCPSWFQSHLGSISTIVAPRYSSSANMRFNPTLVRLARMFHDLGLIYPTSFNPTLVRLARGVSYRIQCKPSSFQSHLGSISTPLSAHLEV